MAVLENHPGPFDLGFLNHPFRNGALPLSQRDVGHLCGGIEKYKQLHGENKDTEASRREQPRGEQSVQIY